jgi:hypothetical protein
MDMDMEQALSDAPENFEEGAEVAEDQGMEESVSSWKAATEPVRPTIEVPRDGIVRLMHGLADEHGGRIKEAEVRELTGEDEEVLSRLKSGSHNYVVHLMDMILRRAVVRIGDVEVQKDPSVLGDLLVADSDLLFKEIILVTFGDHREYEAVECPSCTASNDISVEVDGVLDVKELEGPPFFEAPLRNGSTAYGHFYLAKDKRYVFDTEKRLTTAEYNTRVISRLIDTIDGKPVGRPEDFAKSLSLRDRQEIIKAIQRGPSVNFKEVEVPCSACGVSIPFAFGWADLLPL